MAWKKIPNDEPSISLNDIMSEQAVQQILEHDYNEMETSTFNNRYSNTSSIVTNSENTDIEDADFALALQLQEEENLLHSNVPQNTHQKVHLISSLEHHNNLLNEYRNDNQPHLGQQQHNIVSHLAATIRACSCHHPHP